MAAGFVLFSFMLPLKASAASYEDIYVFGDSISDTGNAFAASGNTFPPYPYYFNGRFTNGYNWIDELAKKLDIDSPTLYADVVNGTTPKNGINFAFGGATTTQANTVTNDFFGLSQEISAFQSYLNQTQQLADPDALYVFWFGANDYLPTDSTNFEPFTTPDQTLANVSNALQTIASLGAKNILVLNLPKLGNTPLALDLDKSIPGTTDTLNALTQEHNDGLSQIIKDLNQDPVLDLNIISLDVDPILDDISKLGFTNTTEPCFNKITLTICANPDEYLYWDEIHPTARAHKIFAGAALAAIPEPSPALGMLALGALSAAGVLKRRQKKSTVSIGNRE